MSSNLAAVTFEPIATAPQTGATGTSALLVPLYPVSVPLFSSFESGCDFSLRFPFLFVLLCCFIFARYLNFFANN
jgi:hypothetical protein